MASFITSNKKKLIDSLIPYADNKKHLKIKPTSVNITKDLNQSYRPRLQFTDRVTRVYDSVNNENLYKHLLKFFKMQYLYKL